MLDKAYVHFEGGRWVAYALGDGYAKHEVAREYSDVAALCARLRRMQYRPIVVK